MKKKCNCRNCKLQKRVLQILERQNIFHTKEISENEDMKNQIIEMFAMLDIVLMTDKEASKLYSLFTNKDIQKIEDNIELRFKKNIKRKTYRRYKMY